MDWSSAISYAYQKEELGGRKGYRLPTIEELSSLIDPNQEYPALPVDHPFVECHNALTCFRRKFLE